MGKTDEKNAKKTQDAEISCLKKLAKAKDRIRRRVFGEKLVHFSSKLTNSNIPAGGIRLSSRMGGDYPYICLKSLLRHGRKPLLDYAGMTEELGAVDVTFANVLRRHPEVLKKLGVADGVAKALASSSRTYCFFGLDELDPRHRQILVPKGDGYVCLTPLGSAGVAATVCETLAKIGDEDGGGGRVRWTAWKSMPVGGAKPQNVGSLAGGLRQVVYEGPRGARGLRAGLRVYRRNFAPLIPRSMAVEFFANLSEIRGGKLSSRKRDAENFLLKKIVDAVENQAKKAAREIALNADVMPDAEDKLTAESRGWIFPETRDVFWRKKGAEMIVDRLDGYPVFLGGQERKLFFSSEEKRRLGKSLADMI